MQSGGYFFRADMAPITTVTIVYSGNIWSYEMLYTSRTLPNWLSEHDRALTT